MAEGIKPKPKGGSKKASGSGTKKSSASDPLKKPVETPGENPIGDSNDSSKDVKFESAKKLWGKGFAPFKRVLNSVRGVRGIGWIFSLVVFAAILVTVFSVRGWTGDGAVFFFKTVLLDNFLGIAALVLGFLVFIGYIILRRGFADSFLGAIKTMIGVLLLAIGSSALVEMAAPIFKGLQTLTSAQVKPLDPYFGWTSANNFLDNGISTGAKYVSWVSFAFIIGLVINILLVLFKRWTNVRSLMVTGHVMFQQASIVTACVYMFLFSGYKTVTTGDVSVGEQFGTCIISGLAVGIYWGVASTSAIRPTQRVTNKAGFTVGHQQMFGAAIAFKIGRFFGLPAESSETKKISKRLKIFEDNIFTQVCIVTTLFLVLIIILYAAAPAGWDPLAKDSPYKPWNLGYGTGTYWLIDALLGSLRIIAALLALTAGVRMFVNELQQAFQGVSMKVVPGAVVAVDVAAVYGFSPNSVTYGFLSGVVAQFAAVGVVIGISAGTGGSFPIVIPLFITLFFNSGAVGVFANASGGYKATLIVPAIMGFFEILISASAIYALSNAFQAGVDANNFIGSTGTSSNSPIATGFIGMFDWNFIWAPVLAIGSQSNIAGWIALFVFMFVMLLIAQLVDSGFQTKATFLQKALRIKPELVPIKTKTLVAAADV